MRTIKLKKKEERRVQRGHPWVFSNEIQDLRVDAVPGELVEVRDVSGGFIGRGYINPRSLIAVRILTRKQEDLDAAFFTAKISQARDLRVRLGFGDSFRAIFSEGDGLPGLIVDKYADTLVVQSLTAGIDGMLDMILHALRDVYDPKTIVLRNDTASREIEGLAQEKRVVFGETTGIVTIEESGIRYQVDVLEGQKTGFFFDQRENRLAIKDLVKGKRALDCFCYVGAWALSAAKYGATEVIGIDSSEKAVKLATGNAALIGSGASSSTRRRSSRAGPRCGRRSRDTKRSTCGPCGFSKPEAFSSPAPVRTISTRNCSGRCSSTRPIPPTDRRGFWRCVPNPATTPCCLRRKRPSISSARS